MNARISTWSPFQSAQVREICANLTPSELDELKRRARGYGTWTAVTAALPISFAITFDSLVVIVVASVLVAVHAWHIPLWMNRQRRFLASTSWAAAQGIKPDSLRLFSLGS